MCQRDNKTNKEQKTACLIEYSFDWGKIVV